MYKLLAPPNPHEIVHPRRVLHDQEDRTTSTRQDATGTGQTMRFLLEIQDLKQIHFAVVRTRGNKTFFSEIVSRNYCYGSSSALKEKHSTTSQ